MCICYIFDNINFDAEFSFTNELRFLRDGNLQQISSAVDFSFDTFWNARSIRCLFSDIRNRGYPSGSVLVNDHRYVEGKNQFLREFVNWKGVSRQTVRYKRDDGVTEVFGHIVADFQGLLLRHDESGNLGSKTGAESSFSAANEFEIRDNLVVNQHLSPIGARLAPSLERLLQSQNGKRLISSVAAPNELDPKVTQGGEAIVCGMLDGAALYASELGRWGGKTEDLHPVRHMIIYAGNSSAQLGRLERRLHILGELRHAALLDYDNVGREGSAKNEPSEISSASRKIRDLGQELDNAIKSEGTRFEISIEQLNEFVKKLNVINSSCAGALLYRVEQSRYYAQSYRELVSHLRVTKVGEFQPYTEFVKRYFYHMFDRIDRVGKRYENMGRRIDRLLYYKQAESSDAHQKVLKGQLDTLNSNASRAGHLLETAENVGWLIAVYYIGSALQKALEHRGLEIPDEFFYVWMASLIIFGFKAARVARKAVSSESKKRWINI